MTDPLSVLPVNPTVYEEQAGKPPHPVINPAVIDNLIKPTRLIHSCAGEGSTKPQGGYNQQVLSLLYYGSDAPKLQQRSLNP